MTLEDDGKDRGLEAKGRELTSPEAAARRNADVVAEDASAPKLERPLAEVADLQRRLSVREVILGVAREKLAEMEEQYARRQKEMAGLETRLSRMRHDIAETKSDALNIAFRAVCLDFRDLTRMRPLIDVAQDRPSHAQRALVGASDGTVDIAVRELSAMFQDHLRDRAAHTSRQA